MAVRAQQPGRADNRLAERRKDPAKCSKPINPFQLPLFEGLERRHPPGGLIVGLEIAVHFASVAPLVTEKVSTSQNGKPS